MKLKKYKLGELIEVTRGQSLSGEYYSTNGKLMRLTLGNFDYRNNCFKDDKSKDNLYFTGPVKKEFILKKDDIITPLTEQAIGLLGSTAKIPCSEKYIQSQDVALICCNEKLNPNFAFYLIPSKTVRSQLSAAAQQTKIRHTSPDKIKDCYVWIPEYSEQEKIGKLLSKIDKKIAINRQINRNLEELAKQIYDYWFVQFDFPNEEGKPYKSSGGKMVWNDVLKRNIPEGWEEQKLGNICEMYQPEYLPIKDLKPNGQYRVYGANGQIGWYDIFNHESSELAMACRGNSCGVINRTQPNSFITSNAMVIKCKNKQLHNEYLRHTLNISNVKKIKSGSGQPQITRENLKDFVVLWADDKIIINYSELIKPIIDQILINEHKITNLENLRISLLPLLMNGQVTLNSYLSHD